MQRRDPSFRFSLGIIVVLVLLLGILASFQYRWIAQLSEAERTRLEAGMDRAAESFCREFDEEVSRAFSIFDVMPRGEEYDLAQELGARMQAWRSTAVWPDLVRDISVIRLMPEGNEVLLRFESASNTLRPGGWTVDVQQIRDSLANRRGAMPIIDSDLPGLILVVEGRGAPGAGDSFNWTPPRDHIVVHFDLDVITGTILPHLAQTHLNTAEGAALASTISTLGRSGRDIFTSGTTEPLRPEDATATARLLSLRPMGNQIDLEPDGRTGPPAHHRGQDHRPGRRPPGRTGPRPPMRTESGAWLLSISHAQGSLEDVVAGVRRRNIAISVAILALLGITTLLMLASTRRAQRLARQQMDFVATISHELRTPLTAIRSAGQNLADGIISEPQRVQNYGALIEREGHRLTEMIGRVLAFAGIRSGRQNFRMAPVDLPEVITIALGDCKWTLAEKDITVEQNIEADLPPVLGDSGALRLVINNLLDNATKYGGGSWIGVESGHDTATDEVWVAVSDRGPGIPRREQKHLFDAFSRGAEASAGPVQGSGLGLAVVRGIVEAHNGRVEVISSRGGPTTFTVRLPAETPESSKREASA